MSVAETRIWALYSSSYALWPRVRSQMHDFPLIYDRVEQFTESWKKTINVFSRLSKMTMNCFLSTFLIEMRKHTSILIATTMC